MMKDVRGFSNTEVKEMLESIGGTAELRIESGRWRWSLVIFAYRFTLLLRLLRLGSRDILERGGIVVGVIPSADACILA